MGFVSVALGFITGQSVRGAQRIGSHTLLHVPFSPAYPELAVITCNWHRHTCEGA